MHTIILLKLLRSLRHGGSLSAAAVAKEHKVSLRTAYRYVAMTKTLDEHLKEAGVVLLFGEEK